MIKQSRGKLTDIVDYRTLLQIKKELKSSAFSLTILVQCHISIPPENVRKPLVF